MSQTPFPYIDKNCSTPGEKIADPEDCTAYYLCVKDSCGLFQKIGLSCNINFPNYDPIKQMCTSDPVDCQNVPIPYTPECKCGDSAIPHPNNPHRYFNCLPQVQTTLIKLHLECVYGTTFNTTTRICQLDNTSYVAPDSCGSPASVDPEINDTCVGASQAYAEPLYYTSQCKEPGIFPDAEDCSRFFLCVQTACGNISKVLGFCSTSLLFDPIQGKCTRNNIKCLCTVRITNFTCQTRGVYPDTECPSQFYSCVLYNKISYTPQALGCSGGLIFDPIRAMCINRTSVEITPTTTTTTCSSVDSSLSSSSSESSEPNDICKNVEGRLSIKDKCNAYYVCINGIALKKYCKKGMVFDQRKKMCRIKKLVRFCTCCTKTIRNNVYLSIMNGNIDDYKNY